jgi:hypothetical protein
MAGAILALLVLGVLIPALFANNKKLSALGVLSTQAAFWVFWALFPVVLLWSICQILKFWRWKQGEGEFCHSCGGMVVYKEGRYGPYFKCLACNKNRKIL